MKDYSMVTIKAIGIIRYSNRVSFGLAFFINNLTIKNNSIFGSTTDNMLVSLDQASGFLNWKVNLNESVTEPFVIGKTVMVFSVTGILLAIISRLKPSL